MTPAQPAMSEDRSSFGYDDHFVPSRSRKKRKNRPPREPPSPSLLLDRTTDELARSDWLRESKQCLRDALSALAFASPEVLCLGLGSPAASRDARAQLAFLLAACDDLCIDRAKVSVYDPVFAEDDLALLAQLRLAPLAENKHARYALRAPTLVFMPHCDLHLYENLLRENWTHEGLARLVLIANSLSDYTESPRLTAPASPSPSIIHVQRPITQAIYPEPLRRAPRTLSHEPTAPGLRALSHSVQQYRDTVRPFAGAGGRRARLVGSASRPRQRQRGVMIGGQFVAGALACSGSAQLYGCI